jgi:L-fuconolactonase
MIVDAQVHIWAADRPDRPWVPGQAARAHRPVPLSHEGLLVEMAGAGVDRAVLVPPSYEGDRNDLVIAAARARPDRFAAMGRLAIEEPGNAALLPGWRGQGMLGIRLTFHLAYQQKWLRDGTADWFWPAAEKHGIHLMVLPTGALPEMEAIAARHPGLRMIIDHLSLHRTKDEPPGVDRAAIDRLIMMARYPNMAVKASALPLFSAEPYPYRDLHDTIRRVFDAYGPRRTFWGSDMTRLPCSYRQAVTMFSEDLPWLQGADREWVMGRALCEWLGWGMG